MLIPLTKGQFARIDQSDAPLVVPLRWHAERTRGGWRAQHSFRGPERRGNILMHRLILGATPGQIVDHINGDSLDNRRSNLRLATASQNAANRRSVGVCPFLGVFQESGKWSASITAAGRSLRIGTWATPELAAAAYNRAAIAIHGEFARLNPVERLGDAEWASFIARKRAPIEQVRRDLQLLGETL